MVLRLQESHNDLNCEDWRSRDRVWDQTHYALAFFQNHLAIGRMSPSGARVSKGEALCLENDEGVIALYLPEGNAVSVDLQDEQGEFSVQWYNPRTGEMQTSEVAKVTAGSIVDLGAPPVEPQQDWAVLLQPKLKLTASSTTSTADDADELIVIEAEDFAQQRLNTVRSWHLTSKRHHPVAVKDADPQHLLGASSGAYLEILPDTRQTHADKLIKNVNFCNDPGKIAVLDYPVSIREPGKYYVWLRAYSTGSEDNGLHVGLNGKWPESGRRLQWCQGKNTWKWESRQRTDANHCGEPGKIFLEVKDAGLHTISFSMREDGFEFDCFLLTRDRDFSPPLAEAADPKQ